MALQKTTIPLPNPLEALTAQDITDIQTTFGILSNLQEVITGGRTYGNANQTFTFNDDSIQFRDTNFDVGFNLSANGLEFTDGTGDMSGKSSFSDDGLNIKSFGTLFTGFIFADTYTANRTYTLPNKDITFAGLSDIITSYLNLTNKPIKAVENATVNTNQTIDPIVNQSYFWNLTGNINLTIDDSNMANGETYVFNVEVTTTGGTETITFTNVETEIYGIAYDPSVKNKFTIEVSKLATAGLKINVFINQPN